jgi:hypothetical protein
MQAMRFSMVPPESQDLKDSPVDLMKDGSNSSVLNSGQPCQQNGSFYGFL